MQYYAHYTAKDETSPTGIIMQARRFEAIQEAKDFIERAKREGKKLTSAYIDGWLEDSELADALDPRRVYLKEFADLAH